ncbi:iron complex outermembrane recepter protein [Roseateles sp. YR242]|uniref:TonB-dependent receptor n=1 Tax=Roseateles sp. YR242 TaxID=1855305 RepID=UPI0008D070FD|nr:TonB-dependent receptor [Roseateles sp. YR242]SEK80987.1 iron complex outermembrane recepter protein [Roseateles sp. YR242]
MSQKNWLGFSKTALAAAAAMVVVMPAMAAEEAKKKAEQSQDDGAPRAKEDTVRLGTIVITGEGGKLGVGQMLNEDAAKARSTVTRAAIDKDRSTGNPYQALALLPGVNTFNYDATGLYGGGMTVRGFGSDQMGFTVNGVPVNDSGSFAVYPQEYADQENLCTQSINQGSPDSDSPAAGATGGNVTITSCDPEDKRRVRFTQTLGELSLTRTFLRYDTGRFFDNSAKVFLSYSHTEADKWKGEGSAKKDHIDAAFRWDINEDNKVLGSVLYNRAINNNINSVSVAQLKANGYKYDYSTTFPGHLTPVAGTAQNEGASGYLPSPAYYKLANNPFENAIFSLSGSFKLATDTYLKVQPYLWYGYGNGGVQQTTLKETGFYNATSGKLDGVKDLNGDGDTLDTIAVGRASVTKTFRPGITTELNTTLGDHNIRVGVWYERARHGQTQPAVTVDNAGNLASVWLDSGNITRADGTLYQGRDWYTVSTAYQAYVMDNWSFLNDSGMLTVGLRTPHVTRDFTGNANESFAYNYKLKRSYDELLPQAGLRFNLDRSQQVFVNVSKNFRAPPNYAFANSTSSINVQADAAGNVSLITELKPETSVMTDVGYRFQSKAISLSATYFNSDFKNRQATAFDPTTNFSANINAGRVNVRGMEFEAGTGVFKGFSAYGSLTVQHSELKDNLTVGKAATASTTGVELPTSGKTYVLTPHTMVGLSVQYEYGPFYGRLKVKRTGHQYATMTNDEEVPAYTVGDFDAGYKIGDVGNWASNVMLRLNVSNIGNTRYRNPSGSQTNSVAYNGSRTNTVYYYLGAPRFTSLSVSADF